MPFYNARMPENPEPMFNAEEQAASQVPQETVPVVSEQVVSAPNQVAEPIVEPEITVAGDENADNDLSGFNSCFRCGRDAVGNVKLFQHLKELVCNFCMPQ